MEMRRKKEGKEKRRKKAEKRTQKKKGKCGGSGKPKHKGT
jgi:hypothetical protein